MMIFFLLNHVLYCVLRNVMPSIQSYSINMKVCSQKKSHLWRAVEEKCHDLYQVHDMT